MSDLKLGKGNQQVNINTENIKAGIKKDQIKDEKLQTIFNTVDANKDGVIDANEMKEFKQKLAQTAGNDTLSNREAGKYLKKEGVKDLDKTKLFEFLDILSQSSENIESSTVEEKNGQKFINIKYKDGSVETINPDKSSQIATSTEGGGVKTSKYDKNKNLTEEIVETEDGRKAVTTFKGDKADKTIITEKGSAKVSTITYGADEKPTSIEVKNGSTTENYTYVDGKPQLTSKVENQGIPAKEKTTNYTYNQDGTQTAVIKEANKETTQQIQNDEVVKETTKEGNKTTENTKTENGSEVTVTEGNTVTKTVYNKENGKMSETKTIDGKEHTVEYDGNGNTKGIIVQNGESIAMLAKKFGCNAEDIINANPDLVKGKGANAYFLVGEEIKIPKELEANSTALQGRTTKESAVQGYTTFMEKKAAEEAAKKAEAEAAEQAQKDANIVTKDNQHQAEMQKQGKKIANDLYNDMDGIGTSKTFDENLKKINKENVVAVIQSFQQKSPDESISEMIFDETGMDRSKRKESVKHIFNQLIAKAEEKGMDTVQAKAEFEKAMNLRNGTANNEDFDPIFNTLVAGINGKSILTKADKEEIKNTPQKELQKQTTQLLTETVGGAEKSLNEQLAKDGWAADLWEGMKWCVSSDNLDEKVKSDINTYKKQIAVLNSATSEADFKAKFKEIYGVNYDPELVKAYQKRQEQLPLVEVTQQLEGNFNKNMAHLLTNNKLAAKTQYIQTSNFGTGNYQEVASREKVYNDELNKFAEFIGKGDKATGIKDIQQAFKDAGLKDNATMDEKYKALHNMATNYSQILHANTMEATEGKGYEVFTTEAESAYKAAFGLKNDVAKRVADYNTSQQTGDMIIKGVVKGGAAIGLALIPGVGLAAAAIGTSVISATVDVTDRMSSDIGLKEGEVTDILKNAAIDGASVYAGGKLAKMLANSKTFVKIGGEFTGDMATGVAAEKLQTGQITLDGVLFQCVFSGAGHMVALKNMGKAPKTPETPTPVLEKASSKGKATPSSVKVGEEKAKKIKSEVKEAIENPAISGDDLAKVHQEVNGLQDREMRRQLKQEIEASVENLTPEQKAAFDAANKAYAQKNVDHILEKHSELNSADTRVMNEYINATEDVSVLQKLKEDLSKKEQTHGGVTENYERLRKSIDEKITSLNPTPVKTNTQQREDVVSMLNEKAQSGKGLSGDDFKQINEYIETINDKAGLKEITGLLNGKRMTASQKTKLKEALSAKTEALKNIPPKVETPEPAKVETPAEPVVKEVEVPKQVEKPETVNPKSVNPKTDFANTNDYPKLSNDELVVEYTKLKEHEASGVFTPSKPSPSGKIFDINSHDMATERSLIQKELEKRGLKLTRDYSKGNNEIPLYGYEPIAKPSNVIPKKQADVSVKPRALKEMSDKELVAEYNRLKIEQDESVHIPQDFGGRRIFTPTINNSIKKMEIENLLKERGVNLKGEKIQNNPPKKPTNEQIKQRQAAKEQAGIGHTNGKVDPQKIQQNSGYEKLYQDDKLIELTKDTKLLVGGNTLVDFENLPADIKNKINLLDEGDMLTLGRNDFNSNDSKISRDHLRILKQDGKLVFYDISSNGTKVFNKNSFEAMDSINKMKNANQNLQSPEFGAAEAAFLQNNGNDLVLLNKLLTRSDVNDLNSLCNIASSTNNNNRAILDKFLNDPTSIRKKSSLVGSTPISQQELSMLMMFNRNHPNSASIISSSSNVKEFLINTENALTSIQKTSPETYQLVKTGTFNSQGRTIKGTASTNALNDIEMLAHGEDYIKHFSNNSNLSDIAKQIPEGDVMSINGRMFVNDGGKMVQLNLSEDKFRELFPPVGRFTTHQGNIGTCYLVGTLDKLMSMPKGRAKLYQMIGEDANGIYTTTANGNWQKDYFKRFPRNYKHMYDKNGLAIIEQGYCKNAKDNYGRKFNASETVIMDIAKGGNGNVAVNGLLGINSNNIRNNPNLIKDFIIYNADNPDCFIAGGTRHVAGQDHSHVLNGQYDIHAGHEYSVKGYNKENNSVLISNPWHSGAVMEVPMDEFLKQFNQLYFAMV